MKILKSWDYHSDVRGKTMFLIKRADPKAWLSEGELPQPGETVEVDGHVFEVAQAILMGDSEFKWWPEIAIFAPTILSAKSQNTPSPPRS